MEPTIHVGSISQKMSKLQDIIGTLHFQIPYYDYLIWFATIPLGTILFILVPMIILIANENRKG